MIMPANIKSKNSEHLCRCYPLITACRNGHIWNAKVSLITSCSVLRFQRERLGFLQQWARVRGSCGV